MFHTVYKKSGAKMEVNSSMLPHLDSLGLSLENPNKKPAVKKPAKKSKKA